MATGAGEGGSEGAALNRSTTPASISLIPSAVGPGLRPGCPVERGPGAGPVACVAGGLREEHLGEKRSLIQVEGPRGRAEMEASGVSRQLGGQRGRRMK